MEARYQRHAAASPDKMDNASKIVCMISLLLPSATTSATSRSASLIDYLFRRMADLPLSRASSPSSQVAPATPQWREALWLSSHRLLLNGIKDVHYGNELPFARTKTSFCAASTHRCHDARLPLK